MAGPTTIEVTENVTTITATGDQISIDLTDDVTTIQAYNLAVPTAVPGVIDASSVTVSAYNTIPSGFLDNALKVLADQNFRSDSTPTGSYIEEGDTWYDTDDNQLKVYRETSSGVFEWVPIILGTSSGDSDTLDGGAF
jgi:predicted small secreted protein